MVRKLGCRTGLIIAIALLCLTAGLAAQSPFQSGPGAAANPRFGPIGSRPAAFIVQWSRALQSGIADLTRRVQQEGDPVAAAASFGLAVVFGMLHIAGPGHGKLFAVSYFSARESRLRDGLAYSAVVNLVDSLCAGIVVLLGWGLLRATVPAFRSEAPRILQLVSYALVVALSLAHWLSHLGGGHRHTHADRRRGDTDRTRHAHAATSATRPPWALAASVGLLPCPISTLLLVFGIANDAVPFMVLMVAGVSFGGFITMSAIAASVIAGRTHVLRRLSGANAARLSAVAEHFASGLIVAVAAVLLVATLIERPQPW